MIQALWSAWSGANPTNHTMVRKMQREAFYAGARAMAAEMHKQQDLNWQHPNDVDPFTVIEGGKDD